MVLGQDVGVLRYPPHLLHVFLHGGHARILYCCVHRERHVHAVALYVRGDRAVDLVRDVPLVDLLGVYLEPYRAARRVVHGLLDDAPPASLGHHERVVVDPRRRRVYLRGQPALLHEVGVAPAQREVVRALRYLVRRVGALLAFAARYEDIRVVVERLLQRAHRDRGGAAAVPVVADCVGERLQPVRVSKPADVIVDAVLVDDRVRDEAASLAVLFQTATSAPCRGATAGRSASACQSQFP